MQHQISIDTAKEVIHKYNPSYIIPFPFERIVKEESLLRGIYYIDFSGLNVQLKKDISGLILYDNKEGSMDSKEHFSIFVSTKDSIKRQYFTVAHELGHYFLHKKRLKEKGLVSDTRESVAMFRGALSNEEETEANYFAAELVMPGDKVREVFELLNGDIDDMANFFKVSKASMAIRLEFLKLDE